MLRRVQLRALNSHRTRTSKNSTPSIPAGCGEGIRAVLRVARHRPGPFNTFRAVFPLWHGVGVRVEIQLGELDRTLPRTDSEKGIVDM